MLNGIPAIGATDSRYTAAQRLQANGSSFVLPKAASGGPPAEVLAALDGAARVHEELHAHGLHVSFDVQPEGDVKVRVHDASGAIIRDLAPAHALELLGSHGAVEHLTQ
jgi:hypothetical protein